MSSRDALDRRERSRAIAPRCDEERWLLCGRAELITHEKSAGFFQRGKAAPKWRGLIKLSPDQASLFTREELERVLGRLIDLSAHEGLQWEREDEEINPIEFKELCLMTPEKTLPFGDRDAPSPRRRPISREGE